MHRLHSENLDSLSKNRSASLLAGLMIQYESKWRVKNNNISCWLKVFCVYRGGQQQKNGLGQYVFGSVRGKYLITKRTKQRVKKLRACVIRRRAWTQMLDGLSLGSWDNSVVVLKTPQVVKQTYFKGWAPRTVGRIKLLSHCKRVL